MGSNLYALETEVRLSESCLWEALRGFYLKEGINAWNGQVPFFITSNVFFAQESARVLASYCFDLFYRKKIDLTQPIYILELGAGTGQFSFYCLQELLRLWSEFFGSDFFRSEPAFKFVYLVTDLSPENINFCQQHEKFKTWKDQGWIEFKVLETDQIEKIVDIFGGELKNPLLVTANYLFDSLKQDAFSIQEGQLCESLMTVQVPNDSISKTSGKLESLKNLKVDFKQEPISPENYYPEDSQPEYVGLNNLLKKYQSKLDNAHFLLPVGTFELLKKLIKISSGKLLLLSTDKGYSTLEDFEGEDEPDLISHGSFSFWVNFHALNHWAVDSGAEAMPIPIGEGIKSAVLLWGDEFEKSIFLNQGIQKQVREFTLSDFFNFYQQFKQPNKDKELSMDCLLSIMRWSRWDPYIFRQFSKPIIAQLNKATANVITGFIEGVDRLVDHIYLLPYGEDLYLAIAVMLHAIHFYERALGFYQMSEQTRGPSFLILFNQALCHSRLGQENLTQKYFKLARELGTPEEIQKVDACMSEKNS